MKRLNKKGFTLVELLAVIIILAIVVGLTIPAVLTVTTNTKKKAFDTAAQEMANWFDRQYQVAISGITVGDIATLDANFSSRCGSEGAVCSNEPTTLTDALVVAAGVRAENVVSGSSKVYIDPNTGRSCVTLVSAKGKDYPDEKTECGGVCNSTDTNAKNYCKSNVDGDN